MAGYGKKISTIDGANMFWNAHGVVIANATTDDQRDRLNDYFAVVLTADKDADMTNALLTVSEYGSTGVAPSAVKHEVEEIVSARTLTALWRKLGEKYVKIDR